MVPRSVVPLGHLSQCSGTAIFISPCCWKRWGNTKGLVLKQPGEEGSSSPIPVLGSGSHCWTARRTAFSRLPACSRDGCNTRQAKEGKKREGKKKKVQN